jgi:5-methylcytosine-specific restriction endonuclease McrA
MSINAVNLPVLVLNQNYEPLNVCQVRRAVVLLYHGKAEMLENGTGFIHTASLDFPLPSVIRLAYMIKRPRPQRKLTRQLTLDHVIPRYRGGEHVWENVVSACIICNRHKAGKTPSEAGMRLIHQPAPPRGDAFFYIPHRYRQTHSQWQKYLPQ